MSTRGKISELFDIEAFKKQQSEAKGLVSDFVQATANVKPIKLQIDGSEQTGKTLKGLTDLSVSMREFQKIVDGASVNQAKLNALQSDAAKKLTETKIALADQNKYLKEEAQLNQTGQDSITQKGIQLQRLRKEYDNLSAAQRNSGEGDRLLKSIQSLDAEYKKLKESTGRFQDNVGNYPKSFDAIEKALGDVNKKLEDFGKKGDTSSKAVAALRKEQELLKQLIDNQKKGFDNLSGSVDSYTKLLVALKEQGMQNSEVFKQLFDELTSQKAGSTEAINALQKALIELKESGLDNTEQFEKLFVAVAKAKDEARDFKKELSTRGSSDLYFKAAAQAGEGLISIYGLAKSTAAALGIENESAVETIEKLEAVTTALASIEKLRELLKKESSIRTVLEIGLQKIQIAQTNLETAAQSRSIVVRYAAIAAQKALNAVTSLSAGPLGIILAVVGLLVLSMSAFAASNTKVTKSLEEMNRELELNKFFLDAQLEAIRNNTKETDAELKARFATEEEIRNNSLKGQQKELDALQKYDDDHRDAYDKALETIKRYGAQKKKQEIENLASQTSVAANSVNALENFFGDSKDISEKAYKDAQDIREKFEANNKELLSKTSEVTVAQLEAQRAAAVEAAEIDRKQLQVQIEAGNSRADFLKRLSADEIKSYDVRRKALIEYFNEQQRVNELLRKQALENPELKPGDASVINAQANAKQIQLKRDQAQQLLELDRANNERIRAAAFENQKTMLEGAANTAQLILSNDRKSYADRIIAADSYYQTQKAQIEAQRDFDLGNLRLNAAEKKNIQQKANAELLKLQAEFGKQMEDLIVSQLQEQSAIRQNRSEINSDNEIVALNQQLNSGIIGITEYERRREEIERRGSIDRLNILLQEIEKTIELYRDAGYDTTALEKSAADIRMQISDKETDHKKENIKKLKELRKQAEEEAYTSAVSIVDSLFDRQKNQIQDQIDALDKKKEKDLEVANATIANEDLKQERISIINKRADAEKQRLEERQKQVSLEKARFDKAANIAKITADTAAAIMAQIKETPPPYGTPFIAAVAAIGALQLARAIATPLPRYKTGTEDHPGGLAIVGDGGRPEPIITPDGKAFLSPSTATVVDLPKHSVVLSDTSKLMDFVAHTTHRNALRITGHRSNGPDIAAMISKQFDKSSGKIVQAIMDKVENHFYFEDGQLRKFIQRGNERIRYIEDIDF